MKKVMKMNKREFSKLYQKMSSDTLSLEEAKKEVKIFIETLEEALIVDESIKFMGKGIFEIFTRQPKIISNPVTRERMKIYPKKTVKFRASKSIYK